MSKHLIHVALRVCADSVETANGMAEGAAAHLRDTFNDDGSLRSLRYYGPGFAVLPLELLRVLIEGADLAGDERERDAEAHRREDEREDEAKADEDAQKYRAAVRRALRIEIEAQPRVSTTRQPASEIGEAAGAVLRIDGNAYALRDGVLWGAPVHADGRVAEFDPAGEWYEIEPAELDAGSAKQAGRALLALRAIVS